MTVWRFSDGTVVHLGGEVEGSSYFARGLRRALREPYVGVQIWPIPSQGHELDRNDVALMHAWLLQEVGRPCDAWMMVSLTEAPENIPDLPPCPHEPYDPDLIY